MSFDVAVVGGGAAGCVVAARLAEHAGRSVCLLEAGPDARGDVPASMRDGWGLNREDFEWGYTGGPKGVPVRGKRVLGGTSWLTRFTPRGAPGDYDAWAAAGGDGWSFDELLPYFRRLEHDADFGAAPWHGDAGPMPSRRYLELVYHKVTEETIGALRRNGFAWVDDHNAPGAVGVGRMPMNTAAGARVTTADAYLPAGATPPNLTIRCDALADAVVFDGATAVGVLLADGSVVEAGWVVLCAGTYGTPPLLLRSGIGAADELAPLGIESRVDLPGVGANLADHPGVDLELDYAGGPPVAPPLHAIATFHSERTPAGEPPDLMFWLQDPEGDPPEVAITVVLLRPRARGSVRLASTDPAAAPLITLPHLTDEHDVARLAEGLRRAGEVAGDAALARHVTPHAPAEDVRAEAASIPHTVGTCALGSVVDGELRVHGTERLSVADASVIPEPPSGFVHFPTIMIAERHADRLPRLL